MSVALRICLVALSIISLFYIIRKIRYSKMQIEYTLFWIVLSIIMILMAVFPQIVYWITWVVGIASPANMVYLFIIGILLVKVFMMTIEISNLESKLQALIQEVGISGKEQRKEYQELSQKKDEKEEHPEV